MNVKYDFLQSLPPQMKFGTQAFLQTFSCQRLNLLGKIDKEKNWVP